MWRDRIARSLRALGIPPEQWRVLELLPLVYTAWADGKVDAAERDRIFDYARERLELGLAEYRLLRQWLSKCPTRDYVVQGLNQLLHLAHAPDEPDVDPGDLQSLLVQCETVARASSESSSDEIWNVCPEEEHAITELATLLQVDRGKSWTEVLRDLEGQPLAAE